MAYALMTSGGKDSTLALDRAQRAGMRVRVLANIYDHDSGRVRFHGVPRDLVIAQARALGLDPLTVATSPQNFETGFLDLLTRLVRLGITGVVFGNIHLEDVRAWYEDRVRNSGLDHIEPLWGEEPATLAREVVARGFRAVLVSGDLQLGAADLVGRELDYDLLDTLATRPDVDPCGEHGEFHTFVYDGPNFCTPVAFERGELIVIGGYRFLELK
ncbi:MAG: diphthine--ammonia ligase [Rhodothermales bacterium]|nr:diphthine--ammonia ligase [Rhodothermales bacterium]